jgi:two-component system, response regulator PdtaR
MLYCLLSISDNPFFPLPHAEKRATTKPRHSLPRARVAEYKETEMAQQLRLVIADDESIIRMNLKETLVGLGYLVVGEAGDGVSVINLARELRPDLAVMDIKMPKLDGIQAAKVLTEERIAPVLLLTAYSDRELVDRAREAGVVSYVVKPFRDAELLPAIEIALARYAEFREMDKQLDDLKEALETRKLVDRAKGILMDTQGLKENEAFRKIQQLSMNSRKSMREVAQAILLTAQIEK